MVKHSLKNLLNKYPVFFDKREISNFYKITKVYNENFKEMYNELYKVYESFHLNKKILIWKEQDTPYEYTMKFRTTHPNLKNVKIFKNDELIYKREYIEEEERDEFEYDYWVKYSRNNIPKLFAYQCLDCGNIYFNYNCPDECEICQSDEYSPVHIYKCEDCGEIYFSQTEMTDCTKNNHTDSLTEVFVYKCRNCGQVYFSETPPEQCDYCYEDEEQTIHTKGITDITSTLHYNDFIKVEDNSEDYTEYGDKSLKVTVKNSDGQELTNAFVTLTRDYNRYESEGTDEYGVCTINNISDGEYDVNVTHRGYIDEGFLLEINENTPPQEITLYKITSEVAEEDDVEFNPELPVIPDDRFVMEVETYDEYYIRKGFPENDTELGNEFDHDFSLDEIGVLNNIPRKNYEVITESDLYPYTEPPYNNRATEDDYHYMKRMIEYSARLWWMSPPCLELWKIYGVESEIINRERYLLKVFDETRHPFDEETGLVKCWTPEPWEHKDKFCDGSTIFGEYFFVEASTVRPIKWESVDFYFKVLNSLAEEIEEEYYVDISLMQYDDNGDFNGWKKIYEKLRDNKARINYRAFHVDKPTVFKFEGYRTNGTRINDEGTIVIVNVRTRADWYVNPDADEGIEDYVGDGSIEKPFLTLEEALKKVNGSLNLISVEGNLILDEELIINHNTIIVGKDNYININDPTTRYVPKIIQRKTEKKDNTPTRYKRTFFKLSGNKNCKLTLSNLRLVSGQINSFVGINSWKNSSSSIDSYETVIITGGAVEITADLNQQKYYPFDFVDIDMVLKKTDGTVLPNNTIQVNYNGNVVGTLTTDEDGECSFKYNLNEDTGGEYDLIIENKSDLFFESQITKTMKATKTPEYLTPTNDDVTITSHNHENGEEFNLYMNDGTVLERVTANANGDAEYIWQGIEFGKYIIYTTTDDNVDDSVRDEWVVESTYYIDDLPRKTFIYDFDIDEYTGDITYETKTLPANPTLADLEGILLDVSSVNDDKELEITSFVVKRDRLTSTELLYSEAVLMKDAVYNIDFDEDTGELKVDRLGQFW